MDAATRTGTGSPGTGPGRNVRQKAGPNRAIPANGWGLPVKRLEDKAPGRVEKKPAAYTSQLCSACGHVADANAARNIAAGHAVTARGGIGLPKPVNREPQLTTPPLVVV